jgi:hypothetical protein
MLTSWRAYNLPMSARGRRLTKLSPETKASQVSNMDQWEFDAATHVDT